MIENQTPQTLFELLERYVVNVPIVQRDYAQGRQNDDARRVRRNLLSDIKAAVTRQSPPLDLSFVYGKVDDQTSFIPLDGQQRLTTLFLLHLYAFHHDPSKTALLKRFTYETRKSSRDFFEQLVDRRAEVFSSELKPSDEIRDAGWFVSRWQHDPTINSAFVMLDEIVSFFDDPSTLASSISDVGHKPLTFSFLDMQDLGMEDSLYIKLNARGKPLSSFENFKARFIKRLKVLDLDLERQFENLLDGKWTDFFWESHKNSFDRTFLAFFGVFFMNQGLVDPDSDWSEVLDYDEVGIDEFWTIYHTLNYVADKPAGNEVRETILAALEQDANHVDRVLFHAVTTYLGKSEGTDEGDFTQWLRIFSNLARNSRIDEKPPYERAIRGINTLEDQWEDLLTYFASDREVSGFSGKQIQEEQRKAQLILKSPSFAEVIYKAESHPYFLGQTRAALQYAERDGGPADQRIFQEYWRKVSALFVERQPKHGHLLRRALLSKGDYTLPVGSYKTLCVDDPNERVRTPSLKQLFSRECQQVEEVLDSLSHNDDFGTQLERMVAEASVPMTDWRRCFLDYPELFELMRPTNLRLLEHRGEVLILPNKWSSGRNRQVFLAALFLALQKRGLAPDYRTDEGASAPHFLYISENSDIYVQQSKAVFTVSREVAGGGGEVLFTSVSDNPLEETSEFIAAGLT